MKLYGNEIGEKPTMEQVEIYIAEKGLFVTPEAVFDYWDKKKWETHKGLPVKTLESAIHVVNSIAVQRKMKEMSGKASSESSGDKKSRKQTFLQEVNETKRKAEEIVHKTMQKKPYIGYSEQLKDNNWKAFRWFVMKVRGEKCEICGETKSLQVHHINYNKNCKAWEYSCKDVMVVCRNCHKKLHCKK